MRHQGKGLTKEGWNIAKQARKTLSDPFLIVISSPKRRCRETVEAMGFKDYLIDKRFSTLQKKRFEGFKKQLKQIENEKKCSWFESLFELEEARKVLKDQAALFLRILRSVARSLPEGGKALVVSHGERIAAASLLNYPGYDLKEIGGALGPCEGAVFYFEKDKDKPVRIEVKRENMQDEGKVNGRKDGGAGT